MCGWGLAWPLLLAPLAAFGTYHALRMFLRIGKLPKSSQYAACIAITLLLSGAAMGMHYEQPSPGSMDKDRWEAMNWISGNTPKDASVYVLYSHVYSQTSSLYNTQRRTYFLELQQFAGMLNSLGSTGELNRTSYVTIPSDSGPNFPYRTGLFSFDRHIATTKTSDNIDICSADYYLIDKAFPQQELTQANLYLMRLLLGGNSTTEYDSPSAAVLRNNNKDDYCIGKQA